MPLDIGEVQNERRAVGCRMESLDKTFLQEENDEG